MKPNWQTLSDIMDNNQQVSITNKRGHTYRGYIKSADHRAIFLRISPEAHKAIWIRDIVDFNIVE